MTINWDTILRQLITNAKSKDGDWDSALYQLIFELYKRDLNKDDKDVLCVLLSLHSAIKKESDLETLAKLCIAHCEGHFNLDQK